MALYFDTDRPQTQEQIGVKFGISQSAVSRRIKAGVADCLAAGLKVPPMPGGRAPKHIAQLSACGAA